MGPLREKPSHFAPLAFDEGNPHIVVGGGLVAQPGDGGSLGSLLEWDAFGPRHGAAAHWGGVRGDELGKDRGIGLVARIEAKKGQHGATKILSVQRLRDHPTLATGREFALIGRIGPLREQVRA